MVTVMHSLQQKYCPLLEVFRFQRSSALYDIPSRHCNISQKPFHSAEIINFNINGFRIGNKTLREIQ